jgi:hypothetical protein
MSGRRKANSKYGVGKLRPVTAVTRGATSQFLSSGGGLSIAQVG